MVVYLKISLVARFYHCAHNFLRITMGCIFFFIAHAASAAQFQQLAVHSKYAFIGVVDTARAVPVSPMSDNKSIDTFSGSIGSKSYYTVAAISLEKIIFGEPENALGETVFDVCSDQDLIAGSAYLFFVGGDGKSQKCLAAVAFQLGSPQAKKPNSAILVTHDVFLFVPEKLKITQKAFALSNPRAGQGYCDQNIVILNSYINFKEFMGAVMSEREKGKKKGTD